MIRDLLRWTAADLGLSDYRLTRHDLAAGLTLVTAIIAVWLWLVVAS
jgi:hypothetical protein